MVAGGPSAFSSAGGSTPPAIKAATGDFLVSVVLSNNGGPGFTADGDLTVDHIDGFGNLVFLNGSAVADGNTLVADGGSSTGFLTDITNARGSATPLRFQAIGAFTAVPEPSALALLLCSAVLLVGRRRSSRNWNF